MKLKVLGTGSSGNCYLLKSEKETLLLDCGIPIKKIKQGLDYNISNVAGVCVSHFHGDHVLALKDLENIGLRTLTPLKDERVGKFLGKFYIERFDLPHNGTENYGFFIKADGQTILYLTDFEYCKYIFKNLNPDHILVECNYQIEKVSRDLANYEHKIKGHCSLDTCKNFILANTTDNLKSVILLHMGGDSCEPEECVAEIRKCLKSSVYVDYARKGMEVELKDNNCPF